MENCSFSCRGIWAPIWKNLSGSSPMTTFSRSSYFTSLDSPMNRDAGASNCYKLFPVMAEVSISGLCWIAAIKHFLAIDWLLTISSTWPPEGYFTFWWRVDETAPKECSQGLPIMAVYGENASTTIKSLQPHLYQLALAILSIL